jgi:hypothetical protein
MNRTVLADVAEPVADAIATKAYITSDCLPRLGGLMLLSTAQNYIVVIRSPLLTRSKTARTPGLGAKQRVRYASKKAHL